MATTHVKYLGLKLDSPIIASSCSLTTDVEKVKEMEHNGVGAVVLKSLFEEQIRNEVEFLSNAGHSYPDMDDYLHAYVRSNSVGKYAEIIRSMKDAVSVPVIASINCYSPGEWIDYAMMIENAGADAIELNLYEQVMSGATKPADVEENYYKVVKSITSELKIPVSVKIGRHFTSIPNFVNRLSACGAKGVVIFNRFFTPDIDLDKFVLTGASPLSHDQDYLETLHWTAILSATSTGIDISATTGIHTPESAIKTILAGASAVQICSVLYEKGLDIISCFNETLLAFMERNNIEQLSDVCGRLNYSSIPDPSMYERVQFMKSFGNFGK